MDSSRQLPTSVHPGRPSVGKQRVRLDRRHPPCGCDELLRFWLGVRQLSRALRAQWRIPGSVQWNRPLARQQHGYSWGSVGFLSPALRSGRFARSVDDPPERHCTESRFTPGPSKRQKPPIIRDSWRSVQSRFGPTTLQSLRVVPESRPRPSLVGIVSKRPRVPSPGFAAVESTSETISPNASRKIVGWSSHSLNRYMRKILRPALSRFVGLRPCITRTFPPLSGSASTLMPSDSREPRYWPLMV